MHSILETTGSLWSWWLKTREWICRSWTYQVSAHCNLCNITHSCCAQDCHFAAGVLQQLLRIILRGPLSSPDRHNTCKLWRGQKVFQCACHQSGVVVCRPAHFQRETIWVGQQRGRCPWKKAYLLSCPTAGDLKFCDLHNGFIRYDPAAQPFLLEGRLPIKTINRCGIQVIWRL